MARLVTENTDRSRPPAVPAGGDVVASGARDTGSADNARVHCPPPLIYLAAVVAAIGVGAFLPLPLPDSVGLGSLGGALVVIALVIALWGFREFRHHRNPLPPNRPVSELMTGGPFRFSRNPLYLALGLLQAGLGLISRNAWILVALVPALLVVRYYVIAREEAYLTRQFGMLYRDYQARVRRWL